MLVFLFAVCHDSNRKYHQNLLVLPRRKKPTMHESQRELNTGIFPVYILNRNVLQYHSTSYCIHRQLCCSRSGRAYQERGEDGNGTGVEA